MIKLNETPVRTSKNFNINNIKLENVYIPKEVKNFDNLTIINENNKVIINNSVSFKEGLTYGVSDFFTKQVLNSANQNIRVLLDSKTNKDIILEFKFDDKNLDLIENIEIVANQDTKSTIIIKYSSEEKIDAFHNGIIRIIAEKNSSINIIIVNLLSDRSNNFLALENILKDDSKVNYTIVDFGGKNSIINYYANIIGNGADNSLNTIYLGKENQLFDLNYIAELRGKKTNVDIEVQGVLKDRAKKHFKGTIDFKKGCKKATGNENENCMLLSNTAKSIALPMLLCSEEDVEGNHSCSAGKIDNKELFYIMSRGFSIKEAQKLMVRAKFNKILENIKNEELKDEILGQIDERLN